jgi:ElaB/YqjD/DUF883 family membrane-anchored ribosome-binding protein
MSEMGQGTGTRIREEAESMGETVQMQAVEVKERGREELRSQLDERTTQVGQQARSFAGALRKSGNELQGQNGDSAPAARVASGVADRIERAGGYLEQARGEDILRDAERFARQRPWLVAGVAAAAGFAASRFLKASSERRYGAYGQSGHETYDRYGDPLSSTRYASPPTVPIGPAGTGSTPAH